MLKGVQAHVDFVGGIFGIRDAENAAILSNLAHEGEGGGASGKAGSMLSVGEVFR